ncbi:hypothetical protein BDV40DRAFT_275876 [Aspergillus tamarii]|uniref:Uncharacterized protein n=1 Tax=Aspergillus tamarii TaxID=41984 RepID=A0A5N6UIT7_ASPTM|nr:hypothetical protein BDV40DRAFT_275876 [Aspergillus tamarii]
MEPIKPSFTPYPSRRAPRRAFDASCSHHTSTDDGFVEEHYRAGGPNLCEFPLVFCNRIQREKFPMRDVLATTKKWNILVITFYLGSFRPRFNLSNEPVSTIRLRAPRQAKERWLGATREIYHCLCGNGLDHFAIEILDQSFDISTHI